MDRLPYNAYAVQILPGAEPPRNKVEELLAVFRQVYPADEQGHTLIGDDSHLHIALVGDILRTLALLAEKPEIHRTMVAEDEMYEALARGIEEKTRELNKAIREAERGREEAERRYAEAMAEIERLRRQE